MKRQALLRQFLADEAAATAIEYALVASIMGACLIAVMGAGGALDSVYHKIALLIPALE